MLSKKEVLRIHLQEEVHFLGKRVHEDIYLLPGKYLLTSRKMDSFGKCCAKNKYSLLDFHLFHGLSHIFGKEVNILGGGYKSSRGIICTLFRKEVHCTVPKQHVILLLSRKSALFPVKLFVWDSL